MFRKLIFLFSLFVCTVAFSQNNEIQFEHLSMKDGLSMNPVMSIIQDRWGYLWFGTQDGLNKYDGYSFKVYKADDTDSLSLSDNFITSLVDDPEGRLWVGTLGGGINCLDTQKGKFRRFNSASGHLENNRIWSLFRDKKDRIWIGTDNGAVIVDPATGNFSKASSVYPGLTVLDNSNVLTVFEDKSGKFWIGTTNGVFVLDPKTNKTDRFFHSQSAASLSNDIVLTIFQDSNEKIWVGTVDGLCRFDEGRFKNYFFKDQLSKSEEKMNQTTIRNVYSIVNNYGGNTIRAVLEDGNKKFWIGTDMELVIFDPAAETFINYKKDLINPMGINDHFIRSMFVDRSKNLWIGTLGSGLNKVNLKPKKFSLYQKNVNGNSLRENYVRTICEGSNGLIYVGTLVGGLNVLDPKTNQFSYFRKTAENSPSSINDNNVWSLASDHHGELWIGTNNGLDRYDPVTKKFRHYQHDKSNSSSISENTIRSILTEENGNVWVGTEGGLNLFDRKTERFKRITKANGLSDNTVWKIIKDRNRNLWLATNDGLNRIDENGNITVYKKEKGNINSISHDGIRTLFEDQDGIIWVGTHNGLNRFDPKTGLFARFFEADGLPNSFIYGILADEKGNLWVSTNKGLCRRDKNSGKFTSYDVFDGLQDYEFNTNACFRTRNGEMYFGGPAGLNRFQPLNLPLNNYVSPVVITSLKVFDKNVEALQKDGRSIIELSYDQNILSFEFASLDYTYPLRNQYAYKMEGFNRDWVNSGNSRFISYTNLDPGEYVFKVRGSNCDGLWNKEEASITITIHPPFWKTTWFYTFCTISVVVLGYLFFRLRVRALQKEKKVLEERVQERTADLEAEKKKVEEANAELEKLSIVASETDNAVIIANGEGEIEWVNQGFERLHGSLDGFRARAGNSIFKTTSHPELPLLVKSSVAENRSVIYESVVVNDAGKELFVQSTLTPIVDLDGSIRKIVIIDTDITERKRAEEIITQKNKDITDSIEYAKRIQQAILPDHKELNDALEDAFILYNPKDIVSGDFYWFTQILNPDGSEILLAAADCTGHGVPGAFMSMIGNALLNEIVKEKKVTDPAQILNMLDEGIRASLKQEKSDSSSMDGMDIALCKLNIQNLKLHYAAAMRPLYLVRDGHLLEFKADKFPIGGRNVSSKKYSSQELQLQKGDCIYIFTDGYPDQFGGPSGKKLMTKNFKKLLLKNHSLPMHEQRKELKQFMNEWKGNLEQIDDILVVGVRI